MLVLLVACHSDPPRAPRHYANIPKIDVHTHIPPERAREALDIFRRNGVVLALNASGGHPGPELLANAAVATQTQGRLRPYCNFDFRRVEQPDFADYARRALAQCEEQGAVGFKIFKSLGLMITLSNGELLTVDDPRLDVVFDAAADHHLPVLIHTGDPVAFFQPATPDNERYAELSAHPGWAFYGPRRDGHGMWPSWDEIYSQFERRVRRSTRTTFVGAHFGNAPEDPARVARLLAECPNLVIETGARVPEIGHRPVAQMREFFRRFHDRILFGTDFQMGARGYVLGSAGEDEDPPERIPIFYEAHWRYFETRDRGFAHPTPIQGDWTIDGLGLSRAELEDLYWRNAARVFRLTLPPERSPRN